MMHHQGREHYVERLIGEGELLDHPNLKLDGQVVPSRFRAGTGDLLCSRINACNTARSAHAAGHFHRQRSRAAAHIQHLLSWLQLSQGGGSLPQFPPFALEREDVIALLAWAWWYGVSKAAQAAQKRGANIITISPQHLRQKNEHVDSTVSWRMIKAIRQDRHNFYFVMSTPGSRIFQAFLIPRHAFASPEEAGGFLARARCYWHEEAGQTATMQ